MKSRRKQHHQGGGSSSPSPLNQQLLKLERELGVQLFHRSRTDWGLTQAGEIYVRAPERPCGSQKDTYNKIQRHRQEPPRHFKRRPDAGARNPHVHLHLSASPQRLPELVVAPLEMTVAPHKKHLQGELDIGFHDRGRQAARGRRQLHHSGQREMVVIIPEGHP